MEKFKTGAKKVPCVIGLSLLLVTQANVLEANAYVPNEYVLGDLQVEEDRTSTKIEDSYNAQNYFEGYDIEGNYNVTGATISEAVQMSDTLNYSLTNENFLTYINTTPSEVYNLDIDSMYEEYLMDSENEYVNFINNNLTNKPALDSYLALSTGSIMRDIRNNIASKISTSILNNTGEYMLTTVYNINDKFYATLESNGIVNLLEINLPTDIIDTYNILRERYTTYQNSIAGQTDEIVGGFTYNGVYSETNESVWYAIGDDELKSTLNSAILTSESILEDEYDINISNDGNLSDEEVEILMDLGYDYNTIQYSTKLSTTLVKKNTYTK